MAQVKFDPHSNVREMNPVRPLKPRAGDLAPRVNNAPRSGLDRLKLSPAHVELIKVCAENLLRKADGTAAEEIAQRFAPAVPEPAFDTIKHPPSPFAPLASGIRKLTYVLLAAALLPNLTLAAFWLGIFVPPWSEPAEMTALVQAPPAPTVSLPVLSAPDTLAAKEGGAVLFPIALDGTDGVPLGSAILVRGLPRGSAFSGGQAQGETEWTLKRDQIGELALALPLGAAGEHRLTLQLLAPNNGILAEAATVLKVATDDAARGAAASATGIDAQDGQAGMGQEPGPLAQDDSTAIAETAAGETALDQADVPPLPARRPQPSNPAPGTGGWVAPTAYVNLREAPSSTGRVLGTIAKGAKLRVLDRKRGWLKVAGPDGVQSGWIYSGHTTALQ